MADKKMSLVPPVKNNEKFKAFIEEPEKKINNIDPEPVPVPQDDIEPLERKKPVKKAGYPWEAPGITPEIIKPYILRLKQPDKLKAEFIVENSLEYRSLQDFCMKAILKQIEKDLKKLEI